MRPVAVTWPAPSTTYIALAQTLSAAGNLVLNGGGGTPGLNTPVVVFPGFTRVVTLTSTANLSGINFTITGTLNNSTISEVLAGPNNNTVTSTNIYDSITSIAASAAFNPNTVSAGIGATGRTQWTNWDYNAPVCNYSVQVAVTGTINYTLNVTLDDANVASPTLTAPITALANATTTQLGNLTIPVKWMNVKINSSGADGALVATFLRQGHSH
jgi:hypothetical protein